MSEDQKLDTDLLQIIAEANAARTARIIAVQVDADTFVDFAIGEVSPEELLTFQTEKVEAADTHATTMHFVRDLLPKLMLNPATGERVFVDADDLKHYQKLLGFPPAFRDLMDAAVKWLLDLGVFKRQGEAGSRES